MVVINKGLVKSVFFSYSKQPFETLMLFLRRVKRYQCKVVIVIINHIFIPKHFDPLAQLDRAAAS